MSGEVSRQLSEPDGADSFTCWQSSNHVPEHLWSFRPLILQCPRDMLSEPPTDVKTWERDRRPREYLWD